MGVLRRRSDEADLRATARKEAVRERLLSATEELLASGRSYAEISVGELARAASVSRTGFYDYFADKRELLLALGGEGYAGVADKMSEIANTGKPLSPETMRAFAERSIAIDLEQAPVLRAFTEAALYDEVVREAWLAYHDHLIAQIEKWLSTRVEAGWVPPGPVPVVAAALNWMGQQTVYQELVASERRSPEDVVEVLAGIWSRVLS